MKKIFSTVALLLLTVSISSGVFAQKQLSKDELFKQIATLSKSQTPGDKEKAYQMGKEFLTRFPKDKEVNNVKTFVKNFQNYSFFKALEDTRFADAFTIGKEILSEQPDNVEITMNLGYAGYDALLKKQDKSFGAEATKYAQQTLDLMEKGNVPANYSPFTNKENALAWMYYIVGNFTFETDSKSAAGYFYKSTLYDTPIKKTAQPYIAIANYYEDKYAAMSKDLNAKSKGLTEAQFKAENEKINVVLEQMMDAYARAYKIGVAENNPGAADWKKRLLQVYLYMKKPEAAFDSFVTYTVSTPFKDPSGF